MKITVVTVCFNEEKNIRRTIESVLQQTSDDFEYIICDGMSTDNTLNIIQNYYLEFKKRNIHFIVKSENDGGVYFGMNNGIELATGEYIIFINAGDTFHDRDVIANIQSQVFQLKQRPHIIYGKTQCIDGNYSYIVTNYAENLKKEMIIHQSIFTDTCLMKKNMFDTKYKISADYDFILRQYLDKKIFYRVNTIVSDYYLGGISCSAIPDAMRERYEIWDKYGISFSKIEIEVRTKITLILLRIKKILPSKVLYFWNIKIKKRNLWKM